MAISFEREIRKAIQEAAQHCERMLKAAEHPLNAECRGEFLGRASDWSDIAFRHSFELRSRRGAL